MIKCFVVDDEAHALELLSGYVQKTPGLELVGAEENPLVALHAIAGGEAVPDVVFVDADMPELTGVELAGLLNGCAEIVFATAYPDYALQAFEKSAIDYLMKPISYGRFLQCVSKVRARVSARGGQAPEEDTYFFVKSDAKGKATKVFFEEITHIEALLNYVKIHVAGSFVVTHLTMKKMEELLPGVRFSRIHKSFIVNTSRVRSVEQSLVTLDDRTELSLGSSYRDAFMRRIDEKLFR